MKQLYDKKIENSVDEPDISKSAVESIVCPFCGDPKYLPWARENGFVAVKCISCGLVYVNPRPSLSLISEAVKTGVHKGIGHERTVIGHRVKGKVIFYKRIIADIFDDTWKNSRKISFV